MHKRYLFPIITITTFIIIAFIWNGYHPTVERAINKYNGTGEVIDIFKSKEDKAVVYTYRRYDGEKSLIIGAYTNFLGNYDYNGDNSLSHGLSNKDLNGFLTVNFYTHPQSGKRYLFGLVNTPPNAEEVRVSYEVPQDKKSSMKKVETRSSVVNDMFLVVVDHVKNKNWLFSFYDENGNLLKETNKFAY